MAALPLVSTVLFCRVSLGGCAFRSLRDPVAQDIQVVWGREYSHPSWIPVNHLSAGLALGECLSCTHSPLWPPHQNRSQGHSGCTGMAALSLQDAPMQGHIQGPRVFAAEVEMWEGAVLQPADAGTFPAESPGLLDKLLSTPDIQDEGEALLTGYPSCRISGITSY